MLYHKYIWSMYIYDLLVVNNDYYSDYYFIIRKPQAKNIC